jgi:tetratricopeptide (TPR) repeat protein
MTMMKSKQTIIAGIALAALGASACSSAPPPPVEQQVQAAPPPKVEAKPTDQLGGANALFARGEYKAALDSYEQILAKDPSNDAAAFNRAVAMHKLGNLDGAKRAYEAIVQKNPADADATINLGAILKDEGKVDEAIGLYSKLLKQDEYNSKVLNNLTALYRLKKQYPKAIDTVRKLLMRDQRNIDAYKNLALVYYDQKKFKLAQTILGNAVKMSDKANRKDPDIYVNLGMIHIALGDNGKAMAAFKQAVEIDPSHIVANYNIGSLALAHRDYLLAERTYGVVAKAWPDNYWVQASLGYALQGQQKLDVAAKQLERARQLKEKEATAMRVPEAAGEEENMVLQLWQIYQNANDAKSALKYADEFLRMKNKACAETDTDEICGRYNGTKLMVTMANQPPPEDEKKKKIDVNDSKIFNDQAAPPEEAAPEGGEGAQPTDGAPPAEGAGGAEAAPADPKN